MKTNTITAGAVLRLTQESDIALLPAIERSAARAFRQIPSLAWLADSEVISVARHHDYLETEHSLLAVAAGQPVGFILTEPLDDALFIVEVAVHQAWQQQGIGRMLLERVIESARQMGYPAVTLTTFREVPWNAPFYTRLGFAMLDELTLPAGLAAKKGTGDPARPAARVALRHAPGVVTSALISAAQYGTKYHSKLTRCYRMSWSIDIISCITDRFVELTATEKRIAQFILDDVAAAAELPIAEIARLTQTSQASVTRFARALGCKDVRELKMKLAQSLAVGQRFIPRCSGSRRRPGDL